MYREQDARGTSSATAPRLANVGYLAQDPRYYDCVSTICSAAFVRSRGAVVGIALAFIFGQNLLASFVGGSLATYLPHSLGTVAASAALERPLPSYAALGSAAILSLLFAAGALWRFGREQL